MAYTRPWSQVFNVPGARNANEIDNAFREGHADLDQRFRDILENVDADPWKLKVGTVTGVTRYHWSSGWTSPPTSGQWVLVGDYAQLGTAGAGGSIYLPVPVPKTQKLVEVKFRLRLAGVGAVANGSVIKVLSTGVGTSVGAVAGPTTPGAWADYSIGVVSQVADNLVSFFAFVQLINGTGTNFAQFADMEVSVGA